MSITVSTKYVEDFISKMQLSSLKKKVQSCHEMLHNKTGEGADFTGWVDLPINYDKEDNAINSDEISRVYGNWFVIKFKFNSGTQKEIETLDCNFSLDKN